MATKTPKSKTAGKNETTSARTKTTKATAKGLSTSPRTATPTKTGSKSPSVNMNTNPNSQVDPSIVARRAYELWEMSGRVPGRDEANWLQAEREVTTKHAYR